MQQFGVILIKGDTIRTLQAFGSKEQALVAEVRFRKERSPMEGGIHVVYGDFDETGNLAERRFLLY